MKRYLYALKPYNVIQVGNQELLFEYVTCAKGIEHLGWLRTSVLGIFTTR